MARVGGLNLDELLKSYGVSRAANINKLLKLRSRKATHEVAKQIDELQKKAQYTSKKGFLGGKKGGWLGRLALGMVSPHLALAEAIMSHSAKMKDYKGEMRSLKAQDVEIPAWARGTSLEKYMRENVQSARNEALQQLQGTKAMQKQMGMLDIALSGLGSAMAAGQGVKAGTAAGKAVGTAKDISKGGISGVLSKLVGEEGAAAIAKGAGKYVSPIKIPLSPLAASNRAFWGKKALTAFSPHAVTREFQPKLLDMLLEDPREAQLVEMGAPQLRLGSQRQW